MISDAFFGFLKFLRSFIGIVLTAAAILGGVTSLCLAGVMTYLHFSAPPMSATDVRLWRWSAVATPIFALLTWAGFRLANGGRAPLRPSVPVRVGNNRPPRRAGVFPVAFWFLVVGFLTWQQTSGTSPERAGKVAAFLAGGFVMFHLRLLLHESGHLFAGALFGMQPVGLQIGQGTLLWQRTTRGGFHWNWRLWPTGGWANNVDRNARPAGWRFFGMMAAGPLADASFAALILLASRQLIGAGLMPAWLIAGATPPSLLDVFRWFLFTPMVLGLLPYRFVRNGALLHSDGWWLARAFFLPAEKLLRTVFTMEAAYIVRLWTAGRQELARAEMDDFLARYPDQAASVALLECNLYRRDKNPARADECFRRALEAGDTLEVSVRASTFTEHAALLARTGDPDAARVYCESLLARTTEAAERVKLLDAFACLPLLHRGTRALLPDAERWCTEAMTLAPEEVTLRGTWGALLVESGREEEAMPILEEVLATTRSDNDRGIASFYLALAAGRLGRRREMRAFRAKALRLCKSPVLASRLRTELPA